MFTRLEARWEEAVIAPCQACSKHGYIHEYARLFADIFLLYVFFDKPKPFVAWRRHDCAHISRGAHRSVGYPEDTDGLRRLPSSQRQGLDKLLEHHQTVPSSALRVRGPLCSFTGSRSSATSKALASATAFSASTIDGIDCSYLPNKQMHKRHSARGQGRPENSTRYVRGWALLTNDYCAFTGTTVHRTPTPPFLNFLTARRPQ